MPLGDWKRSLKVVLLALLLGGTLTLGCLLVLRASDHYADLLAASLPVPSGGP